MNWNSHRENIQLGHRWNLALENVPCSQWKAADVRNGTAKSRQEREKETYKYFGILEADTIKQVEIKERISKENQKATRDKTMSQKPYQKNKYLGCIPR